MTAVVIEDITRSTAEEQRKELDRLPVESFIAVQMRPGVEVAMRKSPALLGFVAIESKAPVKSSWLARQGYRIRVVEGPRKLSDRRR